MLQAILLRTPRPATFYPQNSIAAKIITKKRFTKIIFRGTIFFVIITQTPCIQLEKLEKDHKNLTKIIVSGHYFVIISARMVPPKYKRQPKIPKMPILDIFRCVVGIFMQFQNFGPRGELLFRCFSWKFRVGPSRGAVAGRGVLNHPLIT